MSEPAENIARYEDLDSIPENMIGEIIDGELMVTPRPSARHANTAFGLSSELGPPYRFGRGNGPGGWIILFEPELRLGEHTLVPDLAGWRKERLPTPPEENWITVSPDWVCEILSPSTLRLDKIRKMPIYAGHSVSYLWLLDPQAKNLDVFRLESGRWFLLVSYVEDDKARAEPFQEVEIDLKNLWWE
jgi:Uma2 family endonuclease